jgi:pantoate--beta-alanine ligase
MKIIENPDEMRSMLKREREAGRRIAFVPTMGNLHAGHSELVRRAGDDAEVVVVSIFVNPFQFSADEDFAGYPRTLADDLAELGRLRAYATFVPDGRTIYPQGESAVTRVEVPRLSGYLCGASRPHFFRGVCTVVTILFNIIEPDVALFGQKDYQQLLVIRRMVRDLHMPMEVRGIPTVREPDGLAMSSRNRYLDAAGRARAAGLFRALCRARARLIAGERDFADVEADGLGEMKAAGFEADYFSIRRRSDLEAPADPDDDLVVLGAGWLGTARLIDNVLVREGQPL